MANVTGLIEEFLHFKGKDFIQSIYDEPQIQKLVTNYPQIDGTLHLPTADIEKDLLLGYDGDDTAEDDVISLSDVPMSTTMHKLVLEVDLGGDTMRGYKNYLRSTGKKADEMSIVEYFIMDAQVKEKAAIEIDIAALQGIATFAQAASKPMKETVNGYRRQLKTGATASKVKVVTTGAIDKSNALDQFELMWEDVNSALQASGAVFLVSYRLYNAYRSNYHSTFGNSAVEQFIMGSTYMGIPFHLGSGKSFIMPFAGNADDDGVAITTLKNLAYLYDIDMAASTLDIQKIGFKHKILARMPIGFGIRKLSQKLCIVNDRLIALS